MAGAQVPIDLTGETECYQVVWPQGPEWYALLLGAMSKLRFANYWQSEDEEVLELLEQIIINVVAETTEGGRCVEREIDEVIIYAGVSIPAGWADCDGRELDPEEWPDIFGVIGYTYGGSSPVTFVLPDFRNRVVVGYDAEDSLGLGWYAGDVGGEREHTLTVAELPSHTHGISDEVLSRPWSTGESTGRYRAVASDVRQSASRGGGTTHNNMQPYQIAAYLIYVGFPV